MPFADSGTLTVPSEISDHSATYILLPFPYELRKSFERTIYLYKKANFELLNTKIESFDWNCLINGNVDDAYKLFTETFLEFVNS